MFLFALTLSASQKPVKTDKDKLLKTSPEWEENYMNFQYDDGMLETIKEKIGAGLKIDVYLGTWCGDSRNNIPKFIKIIDGLEVGDNLQVNYFNVERKPKPDVIYYVEELKVERVPTFIFYREGKEIGRIVENPTNSLVEDFLEIIF